MTEVKIIASSQSWIEGAAVQQLHKMAELPSMIRAIGLPDLHPGQGCPVGAAFVTENRIYPHLIGTDIGCGMGLWTTSIQQLRPERLEKKLKGLESGIESAAERLTEAGVESCGHEHSLGTIGRGNHFAELLVFHEVFNNQRVLDLIPERQSENALLLVHSGSRGYGEKILFEHTAIHRDQGLEVFSSEADAYMAEHDHALRWAELNRRVIAERIFDCLDAVGDRCFDIPHNFLEPKLGDFSNDQHLWVHRKGAIPSDRGPVVIPGSRGALSYLVEPTEAALPKIEAAWSLSHGAGRKWSRRDAAQKLKRGLRDTTKGGVSAESLKRTKYGSVVICEDRQLLVEENPEAYKSITQVIQDLVDHNLVQILATLKPILTYKMRSTASATRDHKPRYVRDRKASY